MIASVAVIVVRLLIKNLSSATLVVGPTTAALTYLDPVMGIDLYENCDITGDIAVCVDVVAMAYNDESTSLTTTSTTCPSSSTSTTAMPREKR